MGATEQRATAVAGLQPPWRWRVAWGVLVLATMAALALPRRAPAPARSTGASPPSQSAPNPDTHVVTPSALALRQLAQSKEWISNAVLYSRRYLSPESPLWSARPASQPTRDAPSPRFTPARFLRLDPVSDAPEGNLIFQLEDGRRAQVHVPSRRLPLPLALRPGDAFADTWVEERGLILRPDLTRHASAPLGQVGTAHEIALPLLRAAGAVPIRYEVALLDLGEDDAPVTVGAAQQLDRLDNSGYAGTADYDALAPRRIIEVGATGRYTAVLVVGDRDLRRFLRCTRDGGPPEPIGAYATALPLFVAAANDARSLRLEVTAHGPGERVAVHVHALSGDEVADKELVLWAVPRFAALAEGPGGKVPSQAAVAEAARWLLKSLGVRFSAADALAATEPEQRALLEHLARLSEEVDR